MSDPTTTDDLADDDRDANLRADRWLALLMAAPATTLTDTVFAATAAGK
jgi:hypothetical protein